jgi:3-dehydroquinate synthase
MTLEEMVESVVERCMVLKAGVVAADERESGPRMVLNFGHTAGHAIEQLSGYGLLHGECVAMGMIVACRVGEVMGITPSEVTVRIEKLLTRLSLPTSIPTSFAPDTLAHSAWGDKKRRGGVLRMVLCPAIGTHQLTDLRDLPMLTEAIRKSVEQPSQ